MSTRRAIAPDLLLGAAAGIAATWVMGKASSALYARENEEARRREDEAREGKTAYGVAAEKVGHALGKDLDEEQRKTYGSAIHWGLGAAAGAVYGFLRPRFAWASWGFGSLYGTLFFLTVDEAGNTALGLTPPPQAFPWQTHGRGLASHVVFGMATEALVSLVDDD